ncbi:MAG: glutamate--tRNA ligase [Planctomycetes bacterium]|nr:glutamate--tRNA ligase [Planctomycetota bacterium]
MSQTKPPRVRFAPSPTGYLHIGGARTALFNWLYARRTGGSFILRIEDTDQERSSESSYQAILDSMQWLGLTWDEGPAVGGPHGPYRQTERIALYREFAERLIATGKAYRCICTKEQLDVLRKESEARKRPFRYPGTCRNRRDIPADVPHAVRFITPTEGAIGFDDLVKGNISVQATEMQDEILLRSDGMPLYNFGAVVDDVTMGITLVARGDDHVINTPRQVLMYQALGYEVPRFAHLPMILGADKTRLSKRHGAVSVLQYRDEGYLPEALLNYLARLGWSSGDQEVFTIDELIQKFDWVDCGHNAGVFNPEKLRWVNAEHLKKRSPKEMGDLIEPRFRARGFDAGSRERLDSIAVLFRERARTLLELEESAAFLFKMPAYDPAGVAKFITPAIAPAMDELLALLPGVTPFNHDGIKPVFEGLLAKHNLKMVALAQACRVSISGTTVSPPIFEVMEILGKDETLARLKAGRAIIAV